MLILAIIIIFIVSFLMALLSLKKELSKSHHKKKFIGTELEKEKPVFIKE